MQAAARSIRREHHDQRVGRRVIQRQELERAPEDLGEVEEGVHGRRNVETAEGGVNAPYTSSTSSVASSSDLSRTHDARTARR